MKILFKLGNCVAWGVAVATEWGWCACEGKTYLNPEVFISVFDLVVPSDTVGERSLPEDAENTGD